MSRKIALAFMCAGLIAAGNRPAIAASAYFQAVTNLNPAGYWPMHEVSVAAPGDIETNYGSLGVLGTGFYPDWVPGTPDVIRQQPGALAGDSDPAVYFTQPKASTGSTTNGLIVPHSSPLATLNPPFSVECWYKGNGTNIDDIWSQCGYEGLNGGANQGGGGGAVRGIRLYWNGTGILIYSYFNSSTLQTPVNTAGALTVTAGQWYHIVLTCDASTNMTLWVNGSAVVSAAAVGLFQPDYWTPFVVGNGRGYSRAVNGYVDEVAVYTNVITDIASHYAAGTSANPSPTYYSQVLNDNPTIYLRMDAGGYTAPPVSAWPAVTNYGSVALNGVYSPGTLPGVMAAPSASSGAPLGGLAGGLGATVAQLSGVSSYADVGYNAAYNPVGTTPFSVSVLFRGNPCDARFQTILGHGDNSWRLAMTTAGKLQCQLGTNTTSTITSARIYNDGNWHHAVEVYQPSSISGVTGTNALFVDGLLDAVVTTVTPNGLLPGTNADVLIGSDPQYTNNPAGLGRQFSGQICEVAFFNNALTVSQVTGLYSALMAPPYVVTQPVSGGSVIGGATAGTNLAVLATGAQPLAYLWYFNSNSNYAGAVRLADSGGHYVNSGTAQITITNLSAADSGYYFVIVTNAYGAVTSSLASLNVNMAPLITSQSPVPYTNQFLLFAGANPVFSVAASGAVPLYYYWYTNGVVFGGATNPALALRNIPAGTLSVYCVVSNAVARTTSVPWSAVVLPAPAGPLAQSVLASGPAGYWRLNEADNGALNGEAGVIADDYAGGNDGIYTNTVLGETGFYDSPLDNNTPADFGNWSSVGGAAMKIMGVNFGAPSNSSSAFSVEAWVNGGAQTWVGQYGKVQKSGGGIVAKGYGNGGEQFCLDTGSGGSAFFRFFVRNAGGTAYVVNSSISPASGGWHHLVGVCDQPNGLLNLYVDGESVGTTAIPVGSGIQSTTNYPMSIGARSASVADLVFSNQFLGYISDVAVYGSALNASQILSHYLSAGVAPFFSQQPPATVMQSAGLTLTASATVAGTPPLTNQWWDATANAPLTGQTNATLILSNVASTLDGHELYLASANAFGTSNSSPVMVAIYSGAPQILASNLVPQVWLPVGKTYTFSVTAYGAQPLGYTWYSGSTPVVGGTNATLAVTGTVVGNYAYSVEVTNLAGQLASAVSVLTVVAPPQDSTGSNILKYSPLGYWPLQETNGSAPLATETNYGSLGALGNAYYAVTTASQTNIQFGQGSLLANGDPDAAAAFSPPEGTNFAFVPRLTPAVTLKPPFSLEVWEVSNDGSSGGGDFIGQGGSGLDNPAGSGVFGGARLYYNGGSGNPFFQALIYNSSGNNTYYTVSTPANSLPLGTTNHCVMTYDGANVKLYINGQLATNGTVGTMNIDTWTPLTIGSGRWQGQVGTRDFRGILDEVAVYTNILSATQVGNHYAAGTSPGADYRGAILADAPLLYYRMDCPGYVVPDSSLFPVAVNFGSVLLNGSYQPGVVPGALVGPELGWPAVAAAGNGILSGIDAGNDAAFNLTNQFSVSCWFRSYPADGRLQTLISHGGANWSLDLDGTSGRVVWNTFSGGNVSSTNLLNDGNWHQIVGVYDGVHLLLYADGVLNNSVVAGGLVNGEPAADVFIGGNADFTIQGVNQQFFAGALAQAAVFATALTANQVASIYQQSVSVPTIAIAKSGGNVVVTYSGGSLWSATNVTGPFAPVPGATSPYVVPTNSVRIFYRASNP